MSDDLKIGVNRGGGPPPGYISSVILLEIAVREAMRFLNYDQYAHLAAQFRELATEVDPTHSQTASIDAVEDFHELRDRAGILGGMNVRVFFYFDQPRRFIVVLGAIVKQNNGPTPLVDKILMRNRLRRYLRGEFTGPAETG